MKPIDFLEAARVPNSLKSQVFGNWRIDHFLLPERARNGLHWQDYTLLRHAIYPKIDYSNMHLADDDGRILDIVMEDSPIELSRHLPIWLQAHGRILITGLGLGCVVRGLLASPKIQHIDVIEIDADILSVIGAEFATNPRVSLHHGDALQVEFPQDARWNFAWHDIWTEGNVGLQQEHAKLIMRFDRQTGQQGAWAFPRMMKRLSSRKGFHLLGAARAA